MEFWTNYLGSSMWVFDAGGLPPWRNLQTGVYANSKPSDVDRKFTPSGPYSSEDAQLFPFASQHISGFPTATGARAVSTPTSGETFGPPSSLAQAPSAPSTPVPGQVPDLNPDDFWEKRDEFGNIVPAKPNEAGAVFNYAAWEDANRSVANIAEGFGGAGGRTGPTAAELAIERSKVDAQNLATFISGTIAELEIEVDSRRLSTEQAIGEFDKRLDAFAESGKQFVGIQPFTIPRGAEFLPGRGPGDVGERIGRPLLEASPVEFDPFGMATDIVNESPNLVDIGVPGGDALSDAVAIAKQFLGV